MSINAAPINAFTINGGETVTYPRTGDTVLGLLQVVSKPFGDTVLGLQQAVVARGDTVLSLQQSIYDVDAIAYVDWDIVVLLAGVDISDDLTGRIEIDAERGSARLATFSVLLSGSMDPDSWKGKAVTIDFKQSNGVLWRRFTGVIVEPSINLTDLTMTCRCSDNLQGIVDQHSNQQILDMTGGRWSAFVFSDQAVGWQYLQDVVTTVPVSIQRDAIGHLQATSWQCKAVADVTINADVIDDESLQLSLGQRWDMVNKIDLVFDARFERLFHRAARMIWIHGASFCDNYLDPILFPTQAMVRDAVESAGWTVVAEIFTGLWPSGGYTCSSAPIAWINADATLVRQFNVRVARRWQQAVTHQFKITLKDAASIAAYGESPGSLRGAMEFVSDVQDWDVAGAANSALPTGFTLDDAYNLYRDEYRPNEFTNALRTLIDVGIETIAKSHRATLPEFSIPLAPYLDLSHTVQIDDSNLQAKGVISRLRETYDLDTAEATSSLSISLSNGKSGLERLTNAYTLPAWPTLTATAGMADIIDVPTHLGGKTASPALPEDAWGVVTNYESLDAGAETYPREVRLKFDAIADSKTQNSTIEIAHEILIQTPQNPLTISA